MGWIVAIVVLVLAVYSRGFRTAVLGVVGVAVIAGVLWLAVMQWQSAQARRRVPVQAAVIDDARLEPDGGSGSAYRLTGRLRNQDGRHTITAIDVQVRIEDCPWDLTGIADAGGDVTGAATDDPAVEAPAAEGCDVVGERTATISARVPPGQARDLEAGIYLSPAPRFRGQMRWGYAVTGGSAE